MPGIFQSHIIISEMEIYAIKVGFSNELDGDIGECLRSSGLIIRLRAWFPPPLHILGAVFQNDGTNILNLVLLCSS